MMSQNGYRMLDMSLLAFDFHSLIDVTTVASDSVLLFTVVTVFAIFILSY